MFFLKRVFYGIMLGLLLMIIASNSSLFITYPVPILNSNGTVIGNICFLSVEGNFNKYLNIYIILFMIKLIYTILKVNVVNNLLSILFRIYIPFTLMITLNLIVISRLTKSKQSVHSVAPNNNNVAAKKMSKKEFRFKITMIIIDFTFLAFYTPMAINLTFGIVYMNNGSIGGNPYSDFVISRLFSIIAQLIAVSYSSLIFFIFLIFNRIFRQEFVKMLFCKNILITLSDINSSTKPTANQ